MPCLLCLIWGCCGESESFRSLSMLPLVCLALVWPKISCSSHFDPLFNVLFFSFCSPTICMVSSFELSSKYEIWDCFWQYILSREQPSCCFCAHVCHSRLRAVHLRIIMWALVSIFLCLKRWVVPGHGGLQLSLSLCRVSEKAVLLAGCGQEGTVPFSSQWLAVCWQRFS